MTPSREFTEPLVVRYILVALSLFVPRVFFFLCPLAAVFAAALEKGNPGLWASGPGKGRPFRHPPDPFNRFYFSRSQYPVRGGVGLGPSLGSSFPGKISL